MNSGFWGEGCNLVLGSMFLMRACLAYLPKRTRVSGFYYPEGPVRVAAWS